MKKALTILALAVFAVGIMGCGPKEGEEGAGGAPTPKNSDGSADTKNPNTEAPKEPN
jgi:hypothetical protein